MTRDKQTATVERRRAAATGAATCAAHGHRLGLLGREPVLGTDGSLYCRECAEFYGFTEGSR